jgi:hypothetical protein
MLTLRTFGLAVMFGNCNRGSFSPALRARQHTCMYARGEGSVVCTTTREGVGRDETGIVCKVSWECACVWCVRVGAGTRAQWKARSDTPPSVCGARRQCLEQSWRVRALTSQLDSASHFQSRQLDGLGSARPEVCACACACVCVCVCTCARVRVELGGRGILRRYNVRHACI